jgi:hypothetical protein
VDSSRCMFSTNMLKGNKIEKHYQPKIIQLETKIKDQKQLAKLAVDDYHKIEGSMSLTNALGEDPSKSDYAKCFQIMHSKYGKEYISLSDHNANVI